jgi:hypothetical protein
MFGFRSEPDPDDSFTAASHRQRESRCRTTTGSSRLHRRILLVTEDSAVLTSSLGLNG